MSEWREVAIEDLAAKSKSALATGPFGSAVSSKHFVDDGVPMIRGSNLSTDVGTRLNDDKIVLLSREVAAKFERSTVRSGDLVFTCWGTIGQIGLIDETSEHERYIVSNKQMKLTPNPDLVDSRFLYYALSSSDNLSQVQGQAIGSAVPGFNLGQLRQIRVSIPSVEAQLSITSILKSFDDLIDSNRRRIEILEEMARLLYREWFVQFRFPADEPVDIVDSASGPIPAGWVSTTLGAFSAYVNRGIAPKFDDESQAVVINQRCIRDHRIGLQNARRHIKKVPPDKYVGLGDVLVNSTGVGTLGRVAPVRWPMEDTTVDSHVTIVRPGASVDIDYFAELVLDLEPVFESMGVGSTGQTELARARISEIAIAVPPSDLQRRFGDITRPGRELIVNLTRQNEVLREARDLLLPRLVSGELDVSELDLELEAVS